MPLSREGDHPDLKAILHKIAEFENLNAGTHDKVILTLAGAALTLSLTFSKDLVPPAGAIDRWALLLAWSGFVLTLAINVTGFIVSLINARLQIRLAIAVWRRKTQKPEDWARRVERDEWVLFGMNIGQGVVFLSSMALLAFYVGANLHRTSTDPWAAWAAKWATGG